MNKKLTYNYWLMIVAWCMFLNDYVLFAIIFSLAACVVLSTLNKRINHLRMCLVGLIAYVTISIFLKDSNVSYFFPKLSPFVACICLNCSLTFEHLYLLKSKYVLPYLLVMIISVSVLSIITMILPNSSYSIFTKKSLYLMESLIFQPYLIPCAYVFAYKKIWNHNRRQSLQNKGATL